MCDPRNVQVGDALAAIIIARPIHMQNVAGGTAQASDEISSIEQVSGTTSVAVAEIADWTKRLYARAKGLEVQVAGFFSRVHAA